MLAKTHIAFAVLVGLIITLITDIPDLPLFFALIIIGSILPDIDHESSTINRIIPVTRIVPFFFKHRGFFHSIFPVLLIYLIGYFAGYPTIGLYFCIGYLSHLVSDSLTKLGVNFLHPISTARASGFIQVGTFEETLFFVGLVVMVVVVLAYGW